MFTAKSRDSPKIKAEAASAGPKSRLEPAARVQANPLWDRLATRIQPKLTVGAANDRYEREADRVADQVMRMPDRAASEAPPNAPVTIAATGSPQLRRACAVCEEEEEGKTLQAKPMRAPGNTLASGAAPGIVHDVLRSAGQPLDPTSRAYFEPRFGRDFSQVRIHADARAADSAQAINARAYTAGRNIVFGAGEYAPGAEQSRKLLAHELVHVAQGDTIVRRQPKDSSAADRPVVTRVRRSDIASRGGPKANWYAQFAPQKPPSDPVNVSSIAEAQAWVKDLRGFTLDEKRRFKIGEHLKSMIERMPPEVWLPSNEVLSRSKTDRSSLIVTGTIGPIDTDNLRNKLFTMYLSVDHPDELTKPRDPTGLIWGSDFNIEQFVTEDEKAAEERFSVAPDLRPFQLSSDRFTHREVNVLEFLFPDEMLEWRRRDVEVQESVEREQDRRIGVFMAALGDGSIRAIGQFFKYTFLAGTGAAAAAPVAGWIGAGLGTASWGARFLVGTGTGVVVGAGTAAVDSAISNAPDLVRGDIGFDEYLRGIASDTWSGAKGGAVFGAAGHIASPFLRRFWNVIWPASRPTPPPVAPRVSTSKPLAPAIEPNVATPRSAAPAVEPTVTTSRPAVPAAAEPKFNPDITTTPFKTPRIGWVRQRLREALVRIRLGFANANVVPDMQIGYAKGPSAGVVDTAASARAPATPRPSPQTPAASVADDAVASAPRPVAPAPSPQIPAGSVADEAVASVPRSVTPTPSQAPTQALVAPAQVAAAAIRADAPSSIPAPSEAAQRVAVIERAQSIVDESAQIGRNAIATGDRAVLSEFLYPREVARALQGDARFLGIFVEWRSRYMFALDPTIQPHVGRGGYLGERYVIGRNDPRRGFADFFGTPGGLLSNIPIEITTNRALAAHLNRYYLKRGLILTY